MYELTRLELAGYIDYTTISNTAVTADSIQELLQGLRSFQGEKPVTKEQIYSILFDKCFKSNDLVDLRNNLAWIEQIISNSVAMPAHESSSNISYQAGSTAREEIYKNAPIVLERIAVLKARLSGVSGIDLKPIDKQLEIIKVKVEEESENEKQQISWAMFRQQEPWIFEEYERLEKDRTPKGVLSLINFKIEKVIPLFQSWLVKNQNLL